MKGTHGPYVEELLAHLQQDHHCGHIQVLGAELKAQALLEAQRTTPLRANGTAEVAVDLAEMFEERLVEVEAMHSDHHTVILHAGPLDTPTMLGRVLVPVPDD